MQLWADVRVHYSEQLVFGGFADGPSRAGGQRLFVPALGPVPNLSCVTGHSPFLPAFRLKGRCCRRPGGTAITI